MTELPKIISVDDHVVEPAAPVAGPAARAHAATQGPRVERARWGEFSLDVGASYKQEMTEDGAWGDYWVYEDRLIYVHKRHVAIPLDATPDGDVQPLRPLEDVHRARSPTTRCGPGCYEPKARVDDLALGGRRRLDRVPDVPALLRPDVHGGRTISSSGSNACRRTTTG